MIKKRIFYNFNNTRETREINQRDLEKLMAFSEYNKTYSNISEYSNETIEEDIVLMANNVNSILSFSKEDILCLEDEDLIGVKLIKNKKSIVKIKRSLYVPEYKEGELNVWSVFIDGVYLDSIGISEEHNQLGRIEKFAEIANTASTKELFVSKIHLNMLERK